MSQIKEGKLTEKEAKRAATRDEMETVKVGYGFFDKQMLQDRSA